MESSTRPTLPPKDTLIALRNHPYGGVSAKLSLIARIKRQPLFRLFLEGELDWSPIARVQRRSLGAASVASHLPPKGVVRLSFTARIGRAISFSLPIYSEAAGVVSIARIERPLLHRGGSASTETMPAVSPLPFQLVRESLSSPVKRA